MKGTRRYAGVAVCLAITTIIASCGSNAPMDARRQIDDFPRIAKPDARLAPVAAKTFGDMCTNEELAKLKREPKPEMMAIGGSVFNGVSSMQINWWLSEWSPPAQVWRALTGGATEDTMPDSFRVPRYPDHGLDPYGKFTNGTPHFRLGLDLETIDVALIETAFRRQGWVMSDFARYRATDGRKFNDNISFGGAAVEDLLYGTAADYRARLKAVRRIDKFGPDADKFWADGAQPRTYTDIREHAKRVNGLTDIAKTAGPLKTIFFAENSSFVLNPSGNPCIEQMTPLDQVLFRQPQRLLVGVGSNSGLFTFLYAGRPVDRVCGDVSFTYGNVVQEQKRYVSIQQSSKNEFLADMKTLLDKLAEHGTGIKTIYVMGQLRPRMVANVKPTSSDQGKLGVDATYPPNQVKHDPSTYHDQYFLDFAPEGSGRWLSGEELKAADDLNDEVNNALEQLVKSYDARGGRQRFVFVDLKPLERYDVRHVADRDVLDSQPGVNPVDQTDARKKRPGQKGALGEQIVVTDQHLQGLGPRQVTLDNRVLAFSREEEWIEQQGKKKPIGQRIVRGGIFSVDNLHPTVVGYALLAQRLLYTIVNTEKNIQLADGAYDSISPQKAYARSFWRMEGGQEVSNHGNVLRRRDRGLVAREQLFRRYSTWALPRAAASIAGANRETCDETPRPLARTPLGVAG